MARIPTLFERDDGWSDWQHIRKGYRMACCDCGLAHNIEVFAARKSRIKARPGYITLGKKIGGAVIFLRAGRNERSTAQIRRHRKFAKS